jgi:glycerol-3-phosphate dehydrogenase (NAD(P)+)
MSASLQRIAVVGAGAWGTALALAARRAGRDVTLWARRGEQAEELRQTHRNERYLPGIPLDPALKVTSDRGALADAEAILLAVPAQALRTSGEALATAIPPVPVVLCAKGIELSTGLLLDAVLREVLPGRPLAVLSGPTFAGEVARGLPTAITLAAEDEALGEGLAQALGSAAFRPYWTDDVAGVLVGGAVKNVIAIACGIVGGRRLGENARAALLSRGLAEMLRLARAQGGKRDTMMGLAGLGDLVLSATSAQSRNYALGERLGQGRSLAEAQGTAKGVTEGVATAAAVVRLARRTEVEMPIAAAVDAVLHRSAPIDAAMEALLSRPFKAERG